jgi:hypothetical protein
MVVDCVGIRFVKTGDPFVFAQHGSKEAFYQFGPILRGRFGPPLRVDKAVFVFVEHGNIHAATPTPESPHGRRITAVAAGCARPGRAPAHCGGE